MAPGDASLPPGSFYPLTLPTMFPLPSYFLVTLG